MDISETYQQMCAYTEVQDHWEQKEGDFYYCYCRDIEWCPGGYGITILMPDEADIENHKLADSPTDIWLPRQDQIQEMILNSTDDFDTSIRDITLVCNFAYFCGARNEDAEGRSNVSIRKESLEILWLAFYMYLIHKKSWGGEEWENWDKWENSGKYEDGLGKDVEW